MELEYSYKPRNEAKAVKAMGRDLNISFKDAVVVSDHLRGMRLPEAVESLEKVTAKEKPVPYRRFRKGVGHRKGERGAAKIGKYPIKAAGKILKVLQNMMSNAEYKGLEPEDLRLTHIQAQKGIQRRRRRPKGRWRLWHMQLVNVQAVAEEKPLKARREEKEAAPKKKKEPEKKEGGKKPEPEKEAPKKEKKPAEARKAKPAEGSPKVEEKKEEKPVEEKPPAVKAKKPVKAEPAAKDKSKSAAKKKPAPKSAEKPAATPGKTPKTSPKKPESTKKTKET